MNREDYEAALRSEDEASLQQAYDHAMRCIYDMRFKAETRQAARQYLGKLTLALRAKLESNS